MKSENPPIPLPKSWPTHVRAAILHVISLAQFATAYTRSWSANSEFCAFLGRTIARNAKPKYIICDRDGIFDCHAFRSWVERKRIKPPRYGKAGEHGSIAVVERFILSMKTELIGRISVPMRREAFLRELRCYQEWFNDSRPHTTLAGKTPSEVYRGLRTVDHALNHDADGPAVRPVRSRGRWWLESPVTRSPSVWTSSKVVLICPSFR